MPNLGSLHKIFNTLIDSFIANKIGIADNFLNKKLAIQLKSNLNKLYLSHQLLTAGIGNKLIVDHDNLIRNDRIYWLDKSHNDKFENQFFDLMDKFVSYLNETCYTGITSYEFHYTMYEKGSFYHKHIDQFKNNDSRKYSMILYLNSDWKAGDGGELCIHHADQLQYISPNNRKSVFFKSNELEHEVILNNEPRMSITGWLKVD